jgi:hypothetical protein
MMHFTPFFQFALPLVIPGALIILLAALLADSRRKTVSDLSHICNT